MGTNRYAYAGGDPVNGSDPGGHEVMGVNSHSLDWSTWFWLSSSSYQERRDIAQANIDESARLLTDANDAFLAGDLDAGTYGIRVDFYTASIYQWMPVQSCDDACLGEIVGGGMAYAALGAGSIGSLQSKAAASEAAVPGYFASEPTAASGASSAVQGAQLKEYYRQLEKYGAANVADLQNGRIRFYGDLKKAQTVGEMAGARLVREWDPETGMVRTWYETVDQSGQVRSVAPKPPTGSENHRVFSETGIYLGKR